MPVKKITTEQVRETCKRYRLPLPWAAQIDNCKRLCAGWHNRFGACRVLDNDRLRALCRRLVDDQFTFAGCAWAIEAYYDHCTSDPWRIQHPQARKTLANFFRDDRFEDWIEKGQDLAVRRNQAGMRAAERRRGNAFLAAWKGKSPEEKQALLDRAIADLNMQGKSVELRTFEHPLIRTKTLQYIQRELATAKCPEIAVGDLI
ncbi:MAG TPA: hypothetical protein VM325_16265 [Alphaproteobacteria bacterium]|nr:hypothetical protein [Alphaproteobacteria bacterium]